MKKDSARFPKGSIFQTGYGFIPRSVMQDTELSWTARSIYSLICCYAGSDEKAFPSQDEMSRCTGYTTRTIRSAIVELQESGYITIEKKKDNFTHRQRNVYIIQLFISKPPKKPKEQ